MDCTFFAAVILLIIFFSFPYHLDDSLPGIAGDVVSYGRLRPEGRNTRQGGNLAGCYCYRAAPFLSLMPSSFLMNAFITLRPFFPTSGASASLIFAISSVSFSGDALVFSCGN